MWFVGICGLLEYVETLRNSTHKCWIPMIMFHSPDSGNEAGSGGQRASAKDKRHTYQSVGQPTTDVDGILQSLILNEMFRNFNSELT
jgi:hypothetical protein